MSAILSRVYDSAVAVTKSDTVNDPAGPFAGLLISVTGNVSFISVRGTTVTLPSVPAYTEIHVACSRVNSTGTSATVLGLLAVPFKGNGT